MTRTKAASLNLTTYYGCTIDRAWHNGMYSALTPKGIVKADTLKGVKELIRLAITAQPNSPL